MPYGSYGGYRKRSFRRRSYKPRRFIKKSKGGMVKKMVDGKGSVGYISAGMRSLPYLIKSVSMLKSLVNSEWKFTDFTDNTALTAAGAVFNMTTLAQGTDDNNRIGNSILLKDVILRFTVTINGMAAFTNARIIFLVDKEYDGTTPAVSDILETGVSNDYLATMNPDTTKRFVVIKDYLVSLSPTNSTFSTKLYKLFNIHTQYDGTTAVDASCKENQILMLTIADQPTNLPDFEVNARFKFYDS